MINFRQGIIPMPKRGKGGFNGQGYVQRGGGLHNKAQKEQGGVEESVFMYRINCNTLNIILLPIFENSVK